MYPLQNTKNKTNGQWFLEWFKSGLLLAIIIIGKWLSPMYLDKYISEIPLMLIQNLLFILIAIFGFTFLLRSIGILMMVLSPAKKAFSVHFFNDRIELALKDGITVEYKWQDINRIILNENSDGIYINSVHKKDSYTLPPQYPYKALEKNIDDILIQNPGIVLKKEKQWLESNQKGLNPNKDPNNVNRVSRSNRYEARLIESANAVEMIYYSKDGGGATIDDLRLNNI